MDKLGKYEILSELGRGSFGTVYRARDTMLDIEVALKVLKPVWMDEPTAVEMFYREARAAARLVHPNIVPIRGMDEIDGRLSIEMRLIDGESLGARIKRGPIPLDEALPIVEQIASALSYAHALGLVHRDVKPGNILIGSDGKASLTDFGLVQSVEQASLVSSTSVEAVVGTPAYVAPEIWDGKLATSASDVYAFGCVLFEMLTGKALFSGSSVVEVMRKHSQPPNLEALPLAPVRDELAKVLAPDPAARPGIDGLVAAMRHYKPQPETDVKTDPPRGVSPRRKVLIAIAGLSTIGLGGLVVRRVGDATPMAPTPAPTRLPPTAVPVATNTPPSPTAVPVATNTSQPPTPTPNPVLQRIGTDRAIMTLARGVTMEFVRVRAGEFVMGSTWAKDGLAFEQEMPQHRLILPEYWIGKTEVTVSQFAVFGKASSFKTQAEKDGRSYAITGGEYKEVAGADWAHPDGPATDVNQKQNHPVNHVSWDDCIEYCAWASNLGGGEVMLPSEAEWEKAARGTDGRIYPWGNEAPDETRLNYNMSVRATTQVGQYGVKGLSPYGCDDMAGNVMEWTRSLWGKTGSNPEFVYPYMTRQAERENLRAGREMLRVLRGGSLSNEAQFARCANRFWYSPNNHSVNFGFRVMIRSQFLG